MNLQRINPSTSALLLIDLQNGILSLPLAPYTAEQVVTQTGHLLDAFHKAKGMVVRVRVDLAQLQHPSVDKPTTNPNAPPPPALASELSPQLAPEPSDLVVTKRQWGAFYATELDQQLRRRGIRTIVLGGITTNFGVESTARSAFDRGYELIFVEDAMTSVDAQAHTFATSGIFPYMGRVRSTADVLEALPA